MAVNLVKGQKVNLSKENRGLKRVLVGLGWDADKISGTAIDCDAIAFLLDEKGEIANKDDVIFFGNLKHANRCVTHFGDNLTGDGEGDDEQILIDLANLPAKYSRVVLLTAIYQANERNQHFGMIDNAFIRLVDADRDKELYKYNLSEKYGGKTAMIFGELYRYKDEWKFGAVGQPLNIWAVAQLAELYGLPRSAWR